MMRPGLIGRLDGALQDAAELQEARARAESADAREQRAAVPAGSCVLGGGGVR